MKKDGAVKLIILSILLISFLGFLVFATTTKLSLGVNCSGGEFSELLKFSMSISSSDSVNSEPQLRIRGGDGQKDEWAAYKGSSNWGVKDDGEFNSSAVSGSAEIDQRGICNNVTI